MHKVEIELAASDASIFRWVARHPGAFWLDGPGEERASFMGFAPEAQLRVWPGGQYELRDARGARDAAGEPLRAVSSFVAAAECGDVPRTVGLFSYELGPGVEARIAVRRSETRTVPLAALARYSVVLELGPAGDPRSATRRVTVHATSAALAAARARALRDGVGAGPASDASPNPAVATLLEAPRRDAHRAAVRRALEYIAAGDVYQVNLAQRFRVRCESEAAQVYLELRARQRVPHGVFVDGGAFRVLCNSPERFLRVAGERIETEPIKGTRPRDGAAERDEAQRRALLGDAKERAEHVMIVDLERSDLGRLCVPGTIEVPSLLRIDSFATIHHLVSTVRGRLRPDVDLAEILRATFPGGSVTGAPKIRATQIIAELERTPRQLYTGAIAWFRDERDFDSVIAIRTALEEDGVFTHHAGGGIVADSDPDREYEECWLKAQPFLEATLGRGGQAAIESARRDSREAPGIDP